MFFANVTIAEILGTTRLLKRQIFFVRMMLTFELSALFKIKSVLVFACELQSKRSHGKPTENENESSKFLLSLVALMISRGITKSRDTVALT